MGEPGRRKSLSVRRTATILSLALVLGACLSLQTARANSRNPVVTYFPLPWGWNPRQLAFGADGRVWMGNENGGTLFGAMTTDGQATEYRLHSPVGWQGALTEGPDGNIWLAEGGGGKVASVRPRGRVTEYSVGRHSGPFGLAFGPDGNLWIAQSRGDEVAQLTPTGALTEYQVPIVGAQPLGITAGPGGMWFTLSHAHRIGFIAQGAQSMQLFRLPQGWSPRLITLGQDGNLWFAIDRSNIYQCGAIGRITPSGAVTGFNLPRCQSPFGVTEGPDGNVWFTAGPDIGYVTPQGDVTEYELSGPGPISGGITSGPDGALWFSTYGTGGSIGRLVP